MDGQDEHTFLCSYQQTRRYGSLSNPPLPSNTYRTVIRHLVKPTDTLQGLVLHYNTSVSFASLCATRYLYSDMSPLPNSEVLSPKSQPSAACWCRSPAHALCLRRSKCPLLRGKCLAKKSYSSSEHPPVDSRLREEILFFPADFFFDNPLQLLSGKSIVSAVSHYVMLLL